MDKERCTIRIKNDKLRFKIQKNHGWNEYKRTLTNRDYKKLAMIFFELNREGYPIEKAFQRFKEFQNNPDLFFL